MEKVGKIAELSILPSLCVYMEKFVRMAWWPPDMEAFVSLSLY